MPGDPEGRLLLSALRWAGGPGPELTSLVARVRRWEHLCRTAERRGAGETLAHALAASGASAVVPAAVRDRLRALQELGAARNLLLLAEASRLQAALGRRGIPAVALKGAALVATHYAAPGARHVADLDLLIPAERAAEAAAALAGEGPQLTPPPDHRGRPVAARHHLPPFDSGGVVCELHFQLPGYGGPHLADRVLAGARTVRAPGGGELRIPPDDACAAIACVHALVGHHADARCLPRLVADLEALDATGGLDWKAVRATAGTEQSAAVERGRELLARARQGDAGAVFPGRGAVVARELAALLGQALASPRAVIPSRRFMTRRYRVPERSPRLLLYYFARPVLAVRDRLHR